MPDSREVGGGGDPLQAGAGGAAPGAPVAPSARCDVHAGPANLGPILAAAPGGQVICLATGDYGTFAGARRAQTVTLRAAPGATPSMRLAFAHASYLVLDGITIRGAKLTGSTHDITIRNSAFTSHTTINGLHGANVVFDGDTFLGIDSPGRGEPPARIHLSYGGAHSGVTVRNSVLAGGDADGIQTGVGLDIVGNEFRDIVKRGPNHTDAIQLLGAAGVRIRSNYIHRTQTGIVAYDGLAGAVIEDNVVDLPEQPYGIELYSDDGSVVRHNTLPYRTGCWYSQPCGQMQLSRKSADDPGRGTVVTDNIATQISVVNGSSTAARHHNLLRRGAQAGEWLGAPVFAGGATPGGYAGFVLAPRSPGSRAASDGANVGRRP